MMMLCECIYNASHSHLQGQALFPIITINATNPP
jgi:hypothetical protein